MLSCYKLAIKCMKDGSNAVTNQKLFCEAMDKLFKESKACTVMPFERKMHSRHKKQKAEAAALAEATQFAIAIIAVV